MDRQDKSADDHGMLSDFEAAMFKRATKNKPAYIQEGLLQRGPSGELLFGRFEMTPTGLTSPKDVTVEEYAEVGRLLLDIGSRIQWLIGDWINSGDDFQWGETYKQIAEEFGYQVETLWSYASVCKAVKPLTRVKELSFSHHRTVAKYDDAMQQQYLALAVEHGWSAKEFASQIRLFEAGSAEKPPSWQKKKNSLVRFLTKNRWQSLDKPAKREVYNDLLHKLRELEEWGIDD